MKPSTLFLPLDTRMLCTLCSSVSTTPPKAILWGIGPTSTPALPYNDLNTLILLWHLMNELLCSHIV